MAIKVVTPPTGDVIELADAKSHLRVPASQTLFDSDITAKLAAAVAYIQERCGRALLTQSWMLALDRFPNARWPNRRSQIIQLDGGPVSAITDFSYIDETGTQQTLAANSYQSDLVGDIARLAPLPQQCWPQTQRDALNQVQITYTVGYGDESDVPDPLKQAILLVLGDFWVNREAALDSRYYVINQAVESLIFPHRIILP